MESGLNNIGFTSVSYIIKLRAGFNISHILSFKRQIFVKPDEFENKPTSFIVNYDDISHRIFINEDTVTCFYCKQKRHISNQCPNLNTTTAESSITHHMS